VYPYGLIGNCETAALVSTGGAVDWFCYPRFDSPSIFAAILDRQRGGTFRIAPVNPVPTGEQAYVHDTNILTTTFHRSEGTLVVTDFMPCFNEGERFLSLKRICRGLEARVFELGRGSVERMSEVDVFFFGGGQDREQALVYEDLLEFKQPPLERAVADGAQVLAVCGGYQLLGHYYQTAEGERFNGIGLIDVRTEAGKKRHIGDVVVETEIAELVPKTLVGFENHSGRTLLGPRAKPLGKVILGSGNNGSDGTEGCLQGSVVGTYLHGSLLPKNPHLADFLSRSALGRRGVDELSPLDDSAEHAAHERILLRAQK